MRSREYNGYIVSNKHQLAFHLFSYDFRVNAYHESSRWAARLLWEWPSSVQYILKITGIFQHPRRGSTPSGSGHTSVHNYIPKTHTTHTHHSCKGILIPHMHQTTSQVVDWVRKTHNLLIGFPLLSNRWAPSASLDSPLPTATPPTHKEENTLNPVTLISVHYCPLKEPRTRTALWQATSNAFLLATNQQSSYIITPMWEHTQQLLL